MCNIACVPETVYISSSMHRSVDIVFAGNVIVVQVKLQEISKFSEFKNEFIVRLNYTKLKFYQQRSECVQNMSRGHLDTFGENNGFPQIFKQTPFKKKKHDTRGDFNTPHISQSGTYTVTRQVVFIGRWMCNMETEILGPVIKGMVYIKSVSNTKARVPRVTEI